MSNETKETKAVNRGGLRVRAGRKAGTGKFGEETSVMRIPVSQKSVIGDFLKAYERKKLLEAMDAVTEIKLPAIALSQLDCPLFLSKVSAGLPSPAEGQVDMRLDPNEFLIDQADSTYFVTVQGYSMMDVGLLPGDKVVVDRAKQAAVGDIVMAMVDGDFTVKTLGRAKDGTPRLMPANSTGAYPVIEIKEGMQFEIWGVVTGSFRRFK
jgi:DNA polymerase V